MLRNLLLFACILVVKSQPGNLVTNESSEDELGQSFAELSTDSEDELGLSTDSTAEEVGMSVDELGLSYDVLSTDSTAEEVGMSEDELGLSYAELSTESSFDEVGLSDAESSCHEGSVTNPPVQLKDLNFDSVSASVPPPKTEVRCDGRRRQKACSLLSIKSVLKDNCKCKRRCVKNMKFSDVRSLRQDFWASTRPVRMYHLRTLVEKSLKCGKHRFYELGENKFIVCSRALCLVLDIHKNLLSKAKTIEEQCIKTVSSKKPRDLCDSSLHLINWLGEYATFHGDRMPHSKDVLLPYRTRKSDIYQSYKTELQDETYSPVSRSQFFKIWDRYFPVLKIKKTNSFSKCTTCTMLERQMEKTTCVQERANIKRLRNDHNSRQMLERSYYYSKREASRKNPSEYLSMIVDGMDQSKTNLPHFTGRLPKLINGANLLKTHITGVINHGHGGFYTYVDINEYPHDPNLTINVLLKMLKKTAERNNNKLPRVFYIQADNCWRENKNRYVLAFCELLVAEKIFNEIHLSFLYVGHTHEDVDAAFSKVSEKLRVTDVETYPDLLELLPQSEELGQLYNVKEWLAPAIRDITKPVFSPGFSEGMSQII